MISSIKAVLLVVVLALSGVAIAEERMELSPYCMGKVQFIVIIAGMASNGTTLEEMMINEDNVRPDIEAGLGVEKAAKIMKERKRLLELVFASDFDKENVADLLISEATSCMKLNF